MKVSDGKSDFFEELLSYSTESDSWSMAEECVAEFTQEKDGTNLRKKESQREFDLEAAEEEIVSLTEPPTLEEEVSCGAGVDAVESALTSFPSSSDSRTRSTPAINMLLSSGPVDVEKILENQDAVLSKRRMFVGNPSRKKKYRASLASQGSKSSRASTSMEDRWRDYLLSLEEDFFTSGEARMEENGRVAKGKTAYRGLVLQPENNSDIKRIYEIRYKTKHSLGQPTGSFDQLRIAAGQFARLYFTLERRDPTEFYKPGKLFESITEVNISRALLGYFRLRGSPSTVASKSMHLKTLADHAQIFFSGKNEELKGKAMMVCEFLLSEAASEKKEARRFARQQKTTQERLLRGTMFSPIDFKRGMEVSKEELNKIIASFRKFQGEKGLRGAIEMLLKNEKIVQKWNINFTGLLLLSAGGQRPQVFSQLQLPTKIELESLKRRAEKQECIELRTVIEKTARSFDMPNVAFPSKTFAFVDFHSRIMRPIMKKRINMTEGSLEERTLLIDTRSGYPLSSTQISRTFRRFLSRLDEELAKVTPMALRGSYATMMLQAYRSGACFKEKSEEEFLQFLAKTMNTSVEQLASTYASNEMADFEACAREFTSVLSRLEDEEVKGARDEDVVCDAASVIWG